MTPPAFLKGFSSKFSEKYISRLVKTQAFLVWGDHCLVLTLVSSWFLNPPPAKYQSKLPSAKASSILGNPSRLKPGFVHGSDVHRTGDLCSCWEARLSPGPVSKWPVVVPSLSQECWFPSAGLGTKPPVPTAVKAQELLPWHLPSPSECPCAVVVVDLKQNTLIWPQDV